MLERVYLETSFWSYLAARPSRDLVVAGHQQITQEWWSTQRRGFELCISQLVLQEAGAGDPIAARDRLALIQSITTLKTTIEALALAKELIHNGALPPKAVEDAIHVAVAATNGVQYLLTWNCRHIANARIRQFIDSACLKRGYRSPIICTPEELMENEP